MIISIIIPVYNTKDYLCACVKSILTQSFTDLEILLIDDGSSDGSNTVCDLLAQEDSRIRVYHQMNKGVSRARNLGIEKAIGEWICFVDSDDELLPGGIEAMVQEISDDIDLIMADYIKSSHGLTNYELPVVKEKSIIEREEAMLSMFNDTNRRYHGYSVAKLFRRSIIWEENLLFDHHIAIKEDTLFVVKYLCLSTRKVCTINTPVYLYKLRSSSAMESLTESYSPSYLTSFDACVKIAHTVQSSFPNNKGLLFYSREELINRVYRIIGVMKLHESLNKSIVAKLKKIARHEIGLTHYIDYQVRRNKRRITRIVNKVFKTNFYV